MESSKNVENKDEVGQKWIIHLMNEFGYKVKTGICFGIANMAMQAIIANDLDTFQKRIRFLKTLTPQKINELKEKKNKESIDIYAFFDGIELYQQGYLHPELYPDTARPFAQNTSLTMPLTLPVTIPSTMQEKKDLKSSENSIFQIGEVFSDYYSEEKLITSLEELAKQIDSTCGPISLMLFSGSHAITIGYNPTNEKWSFVDANDLVPKDIQDLNQLVSNIISSFPMRDEQVAFSTKIYGQTSHKDHLEEQIIKWKTEPWADGDTFTNYHAVTEESAEFVDNKGATLLFLAAQQGEINLVSELLNKGADPNAKTNNHRTPIFMAAKQGHLDIVIKLLRAEGFDKSTILSEDKEGKTALTEAIIAGHQDIVFLLNHVHEILRLSQKDSKDQKNIRDSMLKSILEDYPINKESISKFQKLDVFCDSIRIELNKFIKNEKLCKWIQNTKKLIDSTYAQLNTNTTNVDLLINKLQQNITQEIPKMPKTGFLFSDSAALTSSLSKITAPPRENIHEIKHKTTTK
ncbi:MAG: ankyrin repeat domain-containing protein [Gammaproteobacteria bacterium]|nr:ankyrin repeat domain-containing protein [Gammaproteobacteria bacterium]